MSVHELRIAARGRRRATEYKRRDIDRYRGANFSSDIYLRSSWQDRFDQWLLGNSFLRVRDTDVRLSDYMAIEKREAKNCIPRQNQEYVLHVGFNVIGSYTYTNNYLSEIIREFNETVPLGFRCRNASIEAFAPKEVVVAM